MKITHHFGFSCDKEKDVAVDGWLAHPPMICPMPMVSLLERRCDAVLWWAGLNLASHESIIILLSTGF